MASDAGSNASSRMPDTYLILGAIALLVYALSFLVDRGVFAVEEVLRDGRVVSLIEPDSFRSVPGGGLPLFASDGQPGLFNALYEGLVSGSRSGGAVGIIAFILITGGAFGVVMATGAIDRGIGRVAGLCGDNSKLLLSSLFLVFSLSGAVFGMGEEVAPFVLMLLPVMRRLGYGGVTTVMVTYVATQIGFATSWMNPFSLAIAQGIADLPLLSGMEFRLGLWAVFTASGLLLTLRYAARHRAKPELRLAVTADNVDVPLQRGDRWVLAALFLTIAWLIWGVVAAGYYLPEIATQFAVLGILAGALGCLFRLNDLTANAAVEAFRRGAMELLPAAMVVGFARGMVFLLGGDDPTAPSLLNTFLHHASSALDGLPAMLAAWLMLLGQGLFNFFVSSGSGQAALTMPLMAPLADLVGVSRQIAVLAFQLGDGLTNIAVPTSAGLMASLGAARVDWLQWLRASAVFLLVLLVLASVAILVASAIGYQ
ncbi:MAG: putative basic amino acid antiporter YfcC [Haliea sp.]|uniref:putative basic amino acid antiporter YfcC n=1 Tax=Haliea sp. TaxID=1932666 RepID=UPI0032EF50A4